MFTTFARMGVAAALAIALSAGALAQPSINPQGSGSIEMDHSRMGGPPAARSGQASPGSPGLSPQGSGSVEMDHSRMGSGSVGSPAGGTITGNSGSGPEVQHGHEQGRQQQQPRR